mmetsp:Transcript_31734/g.68204  ORF Transcript_31734/g.68204 Transcript_31734/m.68204 type:complete len:143 (+) Transcript_31734:34-462(+)
MLRQLTRRVPNARSQTSGVACRTGVLEPFLDGQGMIVADGGFGTALGAEAQRHPLWGAQLLFTGAGHAQIERVHREFLDAGAQLVGRPSVRVLQAQVACASLGEARPRCPGDASQHSRSGVGNGCAQASGTVHAGVGVVYLS